MKFSHKLIGIILLAASPLLVGSATAQSAGVSVTNAKTYNGDGPWTLGYAFTATSALVVTALGAYDDGNNGFVDAHQVGLWDSTGLLLGSTAVTSGNTLLNGFRYANISGINLVAGQTYTVGASNFGVNDPYIIQGTISSGAGIKYVSANYKLGSGLNDPTTVGTSGGYFGGNILTGAVPEPASWAMMILGMGAVGFAMRNAKRRSDEKFDAKIKKITYGAIA